MKIEIELPDPPVEFDVESYKVEFRLPGDGDWYLRNDNTWDKASGIMYGRGLVLVDTSPKPFPVPKYRPNDRVVFKGQSGTIREAMLKSDLILYDITFPGKGEVVPEDALRPALKGE